MYVGRIVSIGKNKEGKLVIMYRVSSRSFPNRKSRKIGQTVAIVPKKGSEAENSKNPYISYNCLRVAGNFAVAGNGSHADPIVEKLEAGMNMRDALISVLFGMDYEHDDYHTPRIAAVIDKERGSGALGIIRHDALLVENIELTAGKAYYVATYEHNRPGEEFCDENFHVQGAEDACQYVLGKGVFADLELPVSAACAMETETGFSISFKDV